MFLLNVLYSKVSSAKFITFKFVLFCKSFMCMRNKRGPRTEPCGTPTSIFSRVDSYPQKLTYCSLSVGANLIFNFLRVQN